MHSILIQPTTTGLVTVGVALMGVARGRQVQQVVRITPEQAEVLRHMSIDYLYRRRARRVEVRHP